MIQSTKIINGVGTPRLLVVHQTALFSSSSTTFTSDSVTFGGAPDLSAFKAGQRLRSWNVVSGVGKESYGKITAIDNTAKKITVDVWSLGTPTNSQFAYIDGWVIDLPRTQKDGLREYFQVLQLIHELYRNRSASRFQGWGYRCELDYSQYIAGETLADISPGLNLHETDRLILIPRRDAPGFQYNVHYQEGQEILLALYGKSVGYKGPVFAFKSKDTVRFPGGSNSVDVM
ncbi:MAG: hypothetical protein L0Y80_12075 [Ignavibacteriae bacterium]|nr:hypothetical protein [Ignavibacteriota bacterium]